MKKHIVSYAFAMIILFLLLFDCTAVAEEFGPDLIMKGECEFPVTVFISSPSYRILSQFGEDRKEMLNRLIGHFGISTTLDGNASETVLYIDQDQVYSSLETDKESVRETVYSFDPETLYVKHGYTDRQEVSAFSAFLDEEFHKLNRMLDELYPVFEKIPEAFPEYVRTAGVSLTFKGYGKGVKKVTVPIPDSIVNDRYSETLAELAETETSRKFIEDLHFSGSQKMILLYDSEGKLLRVNYDGIIAASDDTARKVSIVWRSLRNEGQKKDHITLKTPAQNGNDRYNLTYEREINSSGSSDHHLVWNLQIDSKAGTTKRKISFTGDFGTTDAVFCGNAVFSEKAGNDERKITIVPTMKKENSSDYTGTIEITNYSGKIVSNSIFSDIHVFQGRKITLPDAGNMRRNESYAGDESQSDPIQDRINSILIRRIMALPSKDIEFLSLDIPDEIWDSLVKSII